MLLYDISMTIEPDMAVYKNRDEKRPRFINSRNFSESSVYETRLELDLHCGTHIDLPLHIIPGGASSDTFSPDHFFSPALLLDFSGLENDRITADDLREKEKKLAEKGLEIAGYSFLLLKTANSFSDHFDFSFVFLEAGGAAWLAGRNLKGVGIDALGIERDQADHQSHRHLLEAEMIILEGLRLAEPPEGIYTLALMPLKISAVEALPARALLLPPHLL